MPKMLVIADDLTGALDTAAQFANQSVAVHVSISARCDLCDLFERFDVVSVNAGTRHEPAGTAARIVSELALRGRAAGAEFFYKKTDSTLRGNLGGELDALRIAVGRGRLAFAPASPMLGRTTVHGSQFVFGQPLYETDYANDPRNPIRESSVPYLLAQQTQARVIVVTRGKVERARSHFFQNEAIYVFDSETDSDLDNVARCLARVGLLSAVAAPAALARCFPHLLKLGRELRLPKGLEDFRATSGSRALAAHRTEQALRPDRANGSGPATAAARIVDRTLTPMLTVVGSVNKVSQRQAAYAAAHGFSSFPISPGLLLDRDERPSRETNDLVSQVAASLAANRPALLQTSRRAADVLAVIEAGAQASLGQNQICECVNGNLARLVRRILDRAAVSALTVFGGDTLFAIAQACGWSGFYPLGELAPGVVYAETEPGGPTRIIAKPGGFGSEDALLRIWKGIAGRALFELHPKPSRFEKRE
ncbi:MAG: hypothetical protein L0Z50_15305 [Verrucomicrobiales bacterium]|nr:hypothetical protein [Verrucomicrobiales bacterium]